VTETKDEIEALRERMDTNRRLVRFDYDKVRSDRDLSDEGKRRRLQEIFEKVFAPPIAKKATGAQREQYMVSIRDAAQRAEAAAHEGGGALEKLFEQASLTGDETLKHQVFVAATQYGAESLTQRYLADKPVLAEQHRLHTSQPEHDDLLARVLGAKGPGVPIELANHRRR
jgi:hypothetical protein